MPEAADSAILPDAILPGAILPGAILRASGAADRLPRRSPAKAAFARNRGDTDRGAKVASRPAPVGVTVNAF